MPKNEKSSKSTAQSQWKQDVHRLHAIEQKLPDHLRTGLSAKAIKTPAKAKHYITKAKAALRKVTVIEVPKPADGSLNKHRTMPVLLRTQLKHFQELELTLPERLRTGIDIDLLQTENDAAEYIKTMTARLHGESRGGKRKR